MSSSLEPHKLKHKHVFAESHSYRDYCSHFDSFACIFAINNIPL